MVPPTFDVEVVRARELSPSVREIVLARCDKAPMVFDAGQWVSLVLNAPEGEIRRAYSIASAPRRNAELEVIVTRVDGGAGSTLLHALAVGDRLRAIGPQGFFTRSLDAPPPALFIGTGTGVAPLRSMILAALDAKSLAPIRLLFGGRAEHDLLYAEELANLAAAHPELQVAQTLSRGSPDWAGRRGYVQAHAAEMYRELAALGGGALPHIYICGLEKMVGAIRTLLRGEMGLPRQQIHSERYD